MQPASRQIRVSQKADMAIAQNSTQKKTLPAVIFGAIITTSFVKQHLTDEPTYGVLYHGQWL